MNIIKSSLALKNNIMTTEVILKQVGNGQITIPKNWRKAMGTDKYKAVFNDNKIFIEPIGDDIELDIRPISLNEINDETVSCIKESEVQYKAGNKKAFLSFDEVFGDV